MSNSDEDDDGFLRGSYLIRVSCYEWKLAEYYIAKWMSDRDARADEITITPLEQFLHNGERIKPEWMIRDELILETDGEFFVNEENENEDEQLRP